MINKYNVISDEELEKNEFLLITSVSKLIILLITKYHKRHQYTSHSS